MEITELKKIIDLTENFKGDYIGPLERFFIDTKFPKLTLFFQKIKDGKIKNDDDAAFVLSLGTPYSGDFKKLKQELEDRILHLLFFIDSRKVPKSLMWKSYIPGFKKWAAAELVFYMGLNDAPYELTKAGYDLIEHIKFGEKKILPLVNLMRFSANMHDFKKRAAHFLEAKKLLQIVQNELEVENIRGQLDEFIYLSEGIKFKNKKFVKSSISHISKIYKSTPTEAIAINLFQAKIRLGNFLNDYNMVIDATLDMDKWHQSKGVEASKHLRADTAVHRLYARVFIRDFVNSEEDLILCVEVFNENSSSWSYVLEILFLHNMHNGNYEKALNAYYKCLKSAVFEKLSPDLKERWKYFEPYLNFVIADDFVKQNLNLLSFLDEISYYTEHKGDNNIPILIGQVISMIEMGEFKKLLERTTYLDNYIKKYVNKKHFMRSHIFLNMLLKLFRNKFDPYKTEEQTSNSFKKLEFREDNKYKYCEEIEVIPYDKLWPMILERLKSKLS